MHHKKVFIPHKMNSLHHKINLMYHKKVLIPHKINSLHQKINLMYHKKVLIPHKINSIHHKIILTPEIKFKRTNGLSLFPNKLFLFRKQDRDKLSIK